MVRDSILNSEVSVNIVEKSQEIIHQVSVPLSSFLEALFPNDGEDNLKRQFRYFYKELFDNADDSVYIPRNVIEQTLASVYVEYLISKSNAALSLKLVKEVIDKDRGLKNEISGLIQKSALVIQTDAPISTHQNDIELVELYNYLSPRLAEIIFHLLLNPIPRDGFLILRLDDTGGYFFTALFSATGIILTDITLTPSSAGFLEYRSFFNERLMIYLKPEISIPPNGFLRTNHPESTEMKVVEVYMNWLTSLAKERIMRGMFKNYTAIVRNYWQAKRQRLMNALKWLIERANHDGKPWDFAAMLAPDSDEDRLPRHRVRLSVVACSPQAPYISILPFQFEDPSRGLSPRAYRLAHIVKSGPFQRGQIEPNLYEQNIDSAIAVPTVSGSSIDGVLYVASSRIGYEFNQEDELILALYSYITGEMITSNMKHRESNVVNYNQIIENPLIMSPLFSGFFPTRDCWHDLERLLKQKERAYGFVIIEIDLHASREEINKNPILFDTQLAVDNFIKSIGSSLFRRAVNHVFSDKPAQISQDLEEVMRKIYQLSIDRFVFIRTLNTIDADNIAQKLNDLFLYIHNDKYNAKQQDVSGLYVSTVAVVFNVDDKLDEDETLESRYRLNHRYVFDALSPLMSLSSLICDRFKRLAIVPADKEISENRDADKPPKRRTLTSNDLENETIGIVINASQL
jgi:hypothetical protein